MPAVGAPLRVAILDDCELVTAGLTAMLADYADRVRIVEVTSELSELADVDVVMADMPGSGDRAAAELRELVRTVPARVVVFSWDPTPQRIAGGMATGAAGFLSRSLRGKEIVDALEAVHDGEVVVRTSGLEVPEERPALDEPGEAEGLSPREIEILALISQGLTNKQVAEQTFLGINSVKTYIRTAYRKIGVTRRAQAVRWGVDHGLDRVVSADATTAAPPEQPPAAR